MEKLGTSSLSSKSSRGSTSRAPVPLPRTKFLAEPDELQDEEGRRTQSKKQAWKKEHKPKGTYSMIKDFLPSRKPKAPNKHSEKSDRSEKVHRTKPEVPPRPRQSKHKQSNPSRSNESKFKEHLPSKHGSVEKIDGHLKTSQSERSLQDIFPSTGSHRREADSPTDPLLAVLAPPSSDNRGNTIPSHGPSQTARAPGLGLLSHVTTQPKITTKEQLVETSQRAMECIQEARGAFSNSQYNKAARKYQKSLDLIDNVLETPLSSLNLTAAEGDKAQQTIFEVRLLRKDALQGFSDCQCEYSLPQSTLDLPIGAPPTYNDVLKEDLMMYNPTTSVGAPPLVPSLVNGRETSRNPDLVTVDPRTPDSTRSRFQAQRTSRIESQLFFTPRTLIPNSREVRDESEISLASNSGSNVILTPAAAPRPDKLAKHREPTDARNIPRTSDGKPSMSVRPKMRQIYDHKTKPVFPPDVNVNAQKNKPRNDPVIPIKIKRSNKYSSSESLSSETSFKSAVSTSKVTPRSTNIDDPDHFRTKNQHDHKYPVLDPFTFEDPFPKQEPTPKLSNNAFSHLNGESINPSSKRLTHKISFLPSTSYHTEIIRHQDTNPFLNSTNDSPLNTSNSVNPFLQQPTDMTLRGGTSHQFVKSTHQIAQHYPVVGVSSSGTSFNYPDEHFSNGKHSENLPAKLEKSVKSVAYETSFSVDDSVLTQSKTKGINPTDTFTKRNRLTKSVVDLSDKKKSATKKSNKRRNLSTMKKLSRSNESILLMFDPIAVQSRSSSDTESGSDEDDFMVDKSTIQSNPVYGTNESATSAITQRGAPTIVQQENGVSGNTENRKQSHYPADPLLVIESNEDELPILNGQTNEESGRPHSLYPKLSASEGMSDRPLPELPRRPQQRNPLSKSAFGEAQETTNVNSRSRDDEVSISATKHNKSLQSGRSLQSARPGHEEKENKHTKSRLSKESKHHSRPNIDDIGGAAVGRSAFYGDSTKSPCLSQNARDRDSVPAVPNRSSSSKKDNPWQEIVQVNEAVKLFFLSDAGVSSPFNRQSLLLLRKYGGRSGEGDSARIEVGGELFARDLHNKNTMVMLDHHGDYIVQSSPGVFLCMVLCSKVKRRDAVALEKTFEIYANFGKESQMMKLPGGIESAAANVKKAVQDKAPGVMKTTSFVKRNSLRALRKLKGAIVGGEEEEEPPKQELGIEFLPLKKACEKFREARQLKNVRYF